MVLFGQRGKKKTVKGSCKMKSQFMNILYNLVKIVVDEGKLLKHFSLFYSIFCYSSLRSVTQCIEPIQLTTFQHLLNGNAISLILSFFIICRFILCSIIVQTSLIISVTLLSVGLMLLWFLQFILSILKKKTMLNSALYLKLLPGFDTFWNSIRVC